MRAVRDVVRDVEEAACLAARQLLFARFVDDVVVEREVRRDPEAAAENHGVPVSFARWLASLADERLTSFRALGKLGVEVWPGNEAPPRAEGARSRRADGRGLNGGRRRHP